MRGVLDEELAQHGLLPSLPKPKPRTITGRAELLKDLGLVAPARETVLTTGTGHDE